MTTLARPALHQFARYAITGGAAAAIEYGLYFTLLYLLGRDTLHVQIAHSTGFIAGALWVFAVNRFWTFRSSGAVHKQAAGYLALLAFNFVATNALLYLLSHHLGLWPELAKVLVTGLMVAWNFPIYKYVIYR
ncbi:Putative flippase GtrA (transmembrane translocase of bactoprenol-linked glucose) [Andreprevotia lacus DSM 23236]|uniref:Putative flippase GtrA (Transmembrane translocase of bactoprenol-linked glucose) n=1 Tax=Andreprevotia lacus DSM 23236 TaxID=1121001 RepID=A0A1W1XR97_9NEIS|nr:GtrA family protein [Andreprevotia lacus]SMC26509.1 Putative flippase GtrA (transmembrane translocase of bactoprenol-linked glucose) [Andreprevotia lacus DSM 23236]